MGSSDAVANEKATRVAALREGTVIDHLRHGTGLRVLHALGLQTEGVVALGLNLDSAKLGRKDLIKIERRELSRAEVNKIAILSPEATLSIIRDYQVVAKFQPELADELEGVVHCANPSCISNHERVVSRFYVLHRKPIRLRCMYCERAVADDQIKLI